MVTGAAWADLDLNPARADAGKKLRPLLVVRCAEACGGTAEAAAPAAAKPAADGSAAHVPAAEPAWAKQMRRKQQMTQKTWIQNRLVIGLTRLISIH